MTCGLACLAVTFSAPLLQTPIIHTAVTMAKDGLLPAQLARDSRVPLVVTEFLLCVLPCFCYDAEDVATVGAVAASVVVCVTVYCCLDIRLSTPGSLVSIADYEQHSRALSAGHKQRKTNAASRYQETIKTLRRGMENLPQTVLAATRSKSNDRQKILAKTESLQSVSATVDSSFQVASENESKALESAVKDYQTKHKTRHHHTNHHHHHHQRSGSEPGLSYACSVTILAAGTSIFSLLLNLSIKLAASGLVIIDLLFLIFVLLPNICGMSRLKQNSQPFHDSYRFPSQGIGATVTLVTAKTLLIRAGFDYAFAVTVWILVGFCTYIFYGSKNSLAALRKRRLHSGPWEAAMSEGESSDPRPDLWRQCGQNEQNYRTNPEEPITEKEEESTKTGQETSEVAVIGTEVLSTSNAVL
ncbi:unnamed protein product [Notodromas monacha]|uniref:Uncharacterized protein n=1 Tax=Notodromas monacha TaxID=399045 RepID=A0A7R9GCI1_9CRUS|nr:unnamed protein product [Notodromas monacha]CAG0916139.1 unnamed protein product [Notodromas monacha]